MVPRLDYYDEYEHGDDDLEDRTVSGGGEDGPGADEDPAPGLHQQDQQFTINIERERAHLREMEKKRKKVFLNLLFRNTINLPFVSVRVIDFAISSL